MRMRTLRFSLCFDGGAYHGWQLQQNAVTVQGAIKQVLEQISGKKETVIGCSRTDAGVHAAIYCCSVRTEIRLDCQAIVRILNSFLPRDITVFHCEEMPDEFHAQFSCVGKEYRYRIWNGKERNPFLDRYTLYYPYPLEASFLHIQSQHYVGKHDFAAFCATGSSVTSTVRSVRYTGVERQGDIVEFTVCADGFLYNMVRIMAGTLLYLAQGKLEPGCIPQLLAQGDRTKGGVTVPPQGLFLTKVLYPDKDFTARWVL